MQKFCPFIGLVGVSITLTLSACVTVPDTLTLQEFQNLVETRYTQESLDCGLSDVTNGYSEQSNPEVVTCLHNAFANGQSAHGYFYRLSTSDEDWRAYSTGNSQVEMNTYSRFLDILEEPEDSQNFYFTYPCKNPSINATPSNSIFLFDCE